MTTFQTPTATVLPFLGTPQYLASLAPHWLKCDGSQVSRLHYPELYLALQTTYGGDGAPNFNLPDLRGLFLRGVDGGTGRDPDAGSRLKINTGAHADGVGSYQADALKAHQHNWDHFFYWFRDSGSDIAAHQPADSMHLQTNPRQATNNDGGGAETRPKNSYVYFMIATGAYVP